MKPMFLLAFGLSLAATSVHANSLTLSQAMALLKEHPQWQAAQAFIEQSQAERVTAGQYLNPSLEMMSETKNRQSLAMVFPLETPSVRQFRQLGADHGVNYATQQALLVQRELKTDIYRSFYQVAQKKQEMQLAKDELSLLEKLRDAVQLKVKVGESARYEGVKAEAEWLTSKTRFHASEQQFILAKQQLAELLGLSSVPNVSDELLSDTQLCQIPKQPFGELIGQYPLFQAAQANLAKDQASTRFEQSLVTPQPTVMIGSEQEPGMDRFKLGVSLPLPLFNQRDGQIATARAKQKQSEATVMSVERQLKQDWSQAFIRYQNADAQLISYESGLLKEAESAFQVAQSAYKYGERGILDFIDAQRTLASVRRGYLTNQFERRYACMDIQQLTQAVGE
jgi:cobalt-zinc-cadmium efflux system outer membrane protein